MYGGYADVYAYSRDSRSNARLGSPSEDSCVACHSCEAVNKVFCGFKRWPKEMEDFILISECEESCGPIPVAIIPRGAGNRVDVNALTLQLLSADYQGLGSSSSIPFADSQALLLDIMPDLHSVINYFTLLDIQARGYVRPMCVAYISSDKFKLVNSFLKLKKCLLEASKAIKYHNWLLFSQDLKKTLLSLQYTKSDNIQVPSPSTIVKIKDELLDSTVEDLKIMENNLIPLIEQEEIAQTEIVKKFQSALHNNRNCPGHPICPVGYILSENTQKPQILKLPLRENFKCGLRSVAQVSSVGFPLALYHFHIMQKFFKRKLENISLNTEEIPKGCCLYFGACLRDSKVSNSHLECPALCNCIYPSIPKSPEIFSGSKHNIDDEYIDLVTHLFYSLPETTYSKENNLENMHSIVDSGYSSVGLSEKYPEMGNSGCDSTHFNEPFIYVHPMPKRGCDWHGASLNKMLDVIECWERTPIESKALDVLRKLSNFHYMVYCILLGYPVLVTGTPDQQQTIKAVVLILGCLVPRTQNDQSWMEIWRETATKPCNFKNVSVTGMPLPKDGKVEKVVPKNMTNQVIILNIKKNTIQGPSYQGVLLSSLPKRLKSLPQDGPLLTLLVSLLNEIEIRVQVWNLLKNKSNQTTADNYFTKKGYSHNDLDILQTLSHSLA